MLLQAKKILTLGVALFVCAGLSFGQTIIQGVTRDARTDKPVANAVVYYLLKTAQTDELGRFYFETALLEQSVVLTFEKSGYQTKTVNFLLSGQQEINIGVIPLSPQEDLDQINAEDFIPLVGLESTGLESLGEESVSGLLTASRDLFVSTAAYNFGAARFRLRGYDARNTLVYLNGAPVNDPGSGLIHWNQWSGLNDVLRNRSNTVGLDAAGFSFGGVGGATMIETRASRHRRGLWLSTALADRSYAYRAMGTLSTGALPNGWAATISGSRRWTQEGYVDGTFYDAFSYFGSLSKQLGARHELNLTVFGAPVTRGLSTPATQEVFELAGSNYYNPTWGRQDGEKRNARVADVHQPMAILRHDWRPSARTTLTTSLAFQAGRNGTSDLEWYDAPDPRPDYYRYLPSGLPEDEQEAAAERFRTDESARQINWANLYNVNRQNIITVKNADGIPGNDVTGRRAKYIVEEVRNDAQRLMANVYLHSSVSNRLTFSGGLEAQAYRGDHFKVINDLLDGDFYVDVDKFSDSEAPADYDRPRRLATEGDTFGYHYRTGLQRAGGWLQVEITSRKLDWFLAGQASYTSFWRNGLWRNGNFPDSSQGKSPVLNFPDYGGKTGFAYKINGRNYLVLSGAYLTRAPNPDNAFLSPRTRSEAVSGLQSEKIYGVEGSYIFRGINSNLRLTGYYTRFENQVTQRSFYLDNPYPPEETILEAGIVNYLMQGVQTQHMGLEFGGELTVAPGLRLNAVAAYGQYTYIGRPLVTVNLDHEAEPLREYTAYIKNFYVPNTPQQAYSVGLNYSSPSFWFGRLNLNYFDEIWLDFNPDRRTTEAVVYGDDPQTDDDIVTPDSELWRQIIFQEQAPAAMTLDFFGGKSWQIGDVFLYITVGVNNILDKQTFINGGFEQYRFDNENKDLDLFANRYSYGQGRSYFVQLALKI